jgi:hypothetical protein
LNLETTIFQHATDGAIKIAVSIGCFGVMLFLSSQILIPHGKLKNIKIVQADARSEIRQKSSFLKNILHDLGPIIILYENHSRLVRNYLDYLKRQPGPADGSMIKKYLLHLKNNKCQSPRTILSAAAISFFYKNGTKQGIKRTRCAIEAIIS